MSNGQDDIPALTPREKQCLTYLAQGLGGKEVADRIGISIRTAEKQIASACKRVGASTREQAVAIAVTLKLI